MVADYDHIELSEDVVKTEFHKLLYKRKPVHLFEQVSFIYFNNFIHTSKRYDLP
jgi:hypothetical protein